jgi:hypothetical protein
VVIGLVGDTKRVVAWRGQWRTGGKVYDVKVMLDPTELGPLVRLAADKTSGTQVSEDKVLMVQVEEAE